jgi:hypothetical protein
VTPVQATRPGPDRRARRPAAWRRQPEAPATAWAGKVSRARWPSTPLPSKGPPSVRLLVPSAAGRFPGRAQPDQQVPVLPPDLRPEQRCRRHARSRRIESAGPTPPGGCARGHDERLFQVQRAPHPRHGRSCAPPPIAAASACGCREPCRAFRDDLRLLGQPTSGPGRHPTQHDRRLWRPETAHQRHQPSSRTQHGAGRQEPISGLSLRLQRVTSVRSPRGRAPGGPRRPR